MSESIKYECRDGLKRIELERALPDIIPSAEKIILQQGGKNGYPFDIGALCYLNRETYKDGGQWNKRGKRVELDTLNEDRVKLVNIFIEYLFNLNVTSKSKFQNCISLSKFIEFCESQNNVVNQLKADKTHESAKVFLNLIQSFYRTNKRVQHIWDFFCYLFEIEGVEGLLTNQHWYRHEKVESTVKPMFDDEVKRVIEFYQALFVLGEDILVKFEKFPYKWNVPEFLKEKDNNYTILPYRHRVIFHKRIAEYRNEASLFDFNLGDWLSTDRAKEKYLSITDRALYNLPMRIEEFKKLMVEVNDSPSHDSRIYFGQLAMTAYRNIFMLLLASNGSGLEGYEDFNEIPWGTFNKNSYAKSYWKFSYQKGRANQKKVEFRLLKTDYPLFNRYLELRKILINAYGKREEDCNLLFFFYNKHKFKPFANHSSFVDSFPEVPHINSQIARATKSDVLLHSTNDIRIVAEILQNTPHTVVSNYAKGTVRGHVKEVGNFLENLSLIVKQTERQLTEIESETGECERFEPNEIDSTPDHIKSDCRSKEGCLFCRQYRVHADERDVRKLLSYLYFIQEAELRLSQTSQFEMYFKPVVVRIESILTYIKQISSHHEEMVIKLEEDVLEDGMLSEFFERELALQEEVRKIWLR